MLLLWEAPLKTLSQRLCAAAILMGILPAPNWQDIESTAMQTLPFVE